MKAIPIPPASLERLRMAYAQFEQLATVVAEAMGLPSGAVKRVEMQDGVFVVDDGSADEPHNGAVTQEVSA